MEMKTRKGMTVVYLKNVEVVGKGKEVEAAGMENEVSRDRQTETIDRRERTDRRERGERGERTERRKKRDCCYYYNYYNYYYYCYVLAHEVDHELNAEVDSLNDEALRVRLGVSNYCLDVACQGAALLVVAL